MKNLLVPIDFSDVTHHVVAAAEQMARAFGAKVWLMHCVGDYPVFAAIGEVPIVLPEQDVSLPGRFPDEYRQLSKLTSTLRDKGIDAESLFVAGLPTVEILTAAERLQVDLIIMGSHGHGALYELVVGTVTEGVLHRTGRPALIVPGEKYKETSPVTAHAWSEPVVTPH